MPDCLHLSQALSQTAASFAALQISHGCSIISSFMACLSLGISDQSRHIQPGADTALQVTSYGNWWQQARALQSSCAASVQPSYRVLQLCL